ncbi:hypothetical protein HG537_0E01000 [Torulaspora globosa]|uniref:FHA domain-containing protein n=1 Tax=Torulaspora globosa TaxID=48254 RepID=A0A7H9HVF9_9SACH|nr:hypothetical protein HG537_0E01000 [Torulaspora sp. CBS 2947]
MWILRYKYDLDDGTIRNVSCCLQSDQTYTIGRSSKSVLNIKNDKSISRNHISVTWSKDNGRITVRNQGKLTAAGGKYLKVDEEMKFQESLFRDKSIVIELGTKPIIVDITWKDAIWDIPQSFSKFTDELSRFGIEAQIGQANVRSTAVVVTENEAQRCLFGLVYHIPLKTTQFLCSVNDVLSSSDAAFDESWNKLDRDERMIVAPGGHTLKPDFSGLKFYMIEQNEQVTRYIQKAITRGRGELVCVRTSEELLGLLKSEDSTENIVVVQSPEFKPAQAGITAFTLDDIVNKVQNNATAKLLGGVPNFSLAAPISESSPAAEGSSGSKLAEISQARQTAEEAKQDVEKPPAKKRRLNRRAVKPLDSLMFFAGGDSFKSEALSDTSIPPSDALEKKAPSPTDELTQAEPEQSLGTTSSLENKEQPTFVEKSYDNHNSAAREPTQPITSNVKSPIPVESHDEQAGAHEKIEESKISQEQDRRTQDDEYARKKQPTRQRTLRDASSGENDPRRAVTPNEDLVEVINDVKNREVKRLNSTLIQVSTDELTEDAINQLGNLAIIRPNKSLIRERGRNNGEQAADHDMPWHGRKNFKNFFKIQPKYKEDHHSDKYREGSSDFIRRSAFPLIKEYVPLKPYSKDQLNRTEDFPAIAKERSVSGTDLDRATDHSPEQVSFTHTSNGPTPVQELFVVDEDDLQNSHPTVPEEQTIHDEEFETADVLPSRQDSGFMHTRKRKTTDTRSPARFSGIGNNDTGDDNDDDDDDDDDDADEPKFKFRRRMR